MLTRRPGWLTPFLVLVVLVGTVLVLRPVSWEATATLTVRPPADAGSVAGSAGSAERLAGTLADMQVGAGPAAGLRTETELGATAPDDGRTVSVRVHHADPRLASAVADALVATTSSDTDGAEVGELSRVPTRPSGLHPALLLGAGVLGSWLVAAGGTALAGGPRR